MRLMPAVRLAALLTVFPASGSAWAAAPAPPDFRLPAGVRPTRYALDLTIVPSGAPFSGTVTIDLALDAPTTIVWLNATDLAVDGAQVRTAATAADARVVPGGSDFVGFELPRPVGPGSAQLVVRYHGTMDSARSRGLYREKEGSGPDDWYAYTFFEPTDARRAFPCFDEPSYKVPWQVTLHVNSEHVALGNAPVVSETREAGGRKAVVLAETKPLPSYLVAVVVGPFDLVDGGRAGRAGTPIRFVVPRGRGAETRYAREVTGRIVELLEEFFDMPYPFVKLDVAVVPRFWGTMEHPGLVALGQPLTLIKPAEEGLERRQRYANIAIHELAHYWFGDYVTCRWWNDVWLNESLATWLDGKLTDRLEPAWKFTLGRDGPWTASAMATDAQPGTQAIRLPVTDRNGIQNSFDNDITYSKGAAVFRMVERMAGEDKFRGAIRAFMGRHAWGNADAQDFLTVLREETGPAAAQVLGAFVEQPGVPLISARVQCDGTPRVAMTQQRFFAAGCRPSEQEWNIPVCVKSGGAQGGGTACTVMGPGPAEVRLAGCPDWVLLNDGGHGYYRSRYDARALAALAAVFGTSLTDRERIQLASDVQALAEQGGLPLGDALTLLPTLLADGDPRVFHWGVRLLELLNPREVPEDLRPALARAIQCLLGERARALGWTPRAGEDPELASLRPALLGLLSQHAGDREVIGEARALADKWLADRTAVAPDMAGPVLAIAARGDDPAFFDRLLAEARRTTDRRERGLLLGALGAFHAPDLNARALALLIGTEFDLRDTSEIAGRAVHDRATRDATWAFLERSWDGLVTRMREDEAMWLFGSVPRAFCDEARRREVERFLAPKAQAQPGATRSLEAALEAARTCESSLSRNRAAVAAFLGRY